MIAVTNGLLITDNIDVCIVLISLSINETKYTNDTYFNLIKLEYKDFKENNIA